jgi:hypothetical protein
MIGLHPEIPNRGGKEQFAVFSYEESFLRAGEHEAMSEMAAGFQIT